MEPNILSLLKKLVSTPSIYPNEKGISSLLSDLFKKKDVLVMTQEVESDRNNIIIEKGEGAVCIALYSHLDTVPLAANWTKKPFQLTIQGDKAYGLGAYDMKGGMAVNIITFLNSDVKNIRLRLIFCVDEENISKGGSAFIESDYAKDINCVLSPEPAFKNGIQGIVTGRSGRGVFEVELHNKPSHYMFYDKKNDLHIFISELVSQLNTLHKETKEGRQFIFIRHIESSAVGMSMPEKALIELDSSLIAPMTNEMLLSELKNIVKSIVKRYPTIKADVRFRKRETPFLSPYTLRPADEYLALMKKTVKKITGKNALPYFRSSVADENIFGSKGISVLGIGPTGANAHAPDEYVNISSLNMLYDIYTDFISELDLYENTKSR